MLMEVSLTFSSGYQGGGNEIPSRPNRGLLISGYETPIWKLYGTCFGLIGISKSEESTMDISRRNTDVSY